MTLMNAVMCDAISEDIGSVSLREVELPEPGPGEVRVRLKACAVNFPDLLMIQGKYQFKPPLPFAPGGEAAGDVEASGPGVSVKEGDAVVVSMRYGGFAEAVVVAESQLKPLPKGHGLRQGSELSNRVFNGLRGPVSARRFTSGRAFTGAWCHGRCRHGGGGFG